MVGAKNSNIDRRPYCRSFDFAQDDVANIFELKNRHSELVEESGVMGTPSHLQQKIGPRAMFVGEAVIFPPAKYAGTLLFD